MPTSHLGSAPVPTRPRGPWTPDLGNGLYRNPVIHADYSDPDVVRVGDDFYLTASSFHCTPGLPILHSRDLVNWSIVGHALTNLPSQYYDEVRAGHGVWAPAIRWHAGRFWIIVGLPDHGLYVITAERAEGPWSPPHQLVAGKGLIDPCMLWDDDGQAYVVHAYARSRSGLRNRLHVRPVSPDLRQVLGPGQVIAAIDERLPALEGPKWLKRDGWYYVSAPSGGVAMGWQTVFRSRHVYGPYEERIVLAQRGTSVNGPHQGALVDTADGEWWFVHFQDVGPYGRVVHLQPVRWEHDWPLVGVEHDDRGVGRPTLVHRKPRVGGRFPGCEPQTSDDFSGDRLGLQWQWNANHDPAWHSLSARPGRLRLFSRFVLGGDLRVAPHLLCQKFPAREFAVETEVELANDSGSSDAGLAVLGGEFAAIVAARSPGGLRLVLRTEVEQRGEVVLPHDGPVRLRLEVAEGGCCRFFYDDAADGWQQLGPEFFARAGAWTGARFGIFCGTAEPAATADAGHADFGPVRVMPLDRRAPA
jgi:beta-xylosidase